MRALLGSLLFTFCCALSLQDTYMIKENEVYSTHLLPTAPKFLITRFGNAFELDLPSSEVISLFERYGLRVEASSPQIHLIYQSPWEFKELKEQIRAFFLSAYPTLKIQSLSLKPKTPPLSPQDLKASLTPSMLKKSKFEFLAQNARENLVFLCEIVGKIEVYRAREDIKPRTLFGAENIQKSSIAFEGFSQEPASEEDLKDTQAKSFIKKNQIITRNKLAAKILVWRGEMIDVVLKEGEVQIEAQVEAMQNAIKGEVINAKNLESKKILKVKITAQGKGEVL